MKRSFCLFLAMILTVMFLNAPHVFADADELPVIPAPGYQEKVRGDANGDGKINYQDALLVLRHSIALEKLSSSVVELCDVDGSGHLNYQDALLILRKSIGLTDKF